MANLGTLTLDLIARIGGFTGPLDKAARESKKHMGSIQQSADSASASIKGLANAAGASISVAAITAVATETAKAALELQRMDRQFRVSTGSVLLAGDSLKFVRDEADRLGMDVKDLTGSYGRFMNAVKGTANEGEHGRKAFIGISEGIAAVGLSVDEQSRVWAQLSQGIMKGKFEMEDLKTIQEAGLPIVKLMADALGKTTDEIFEMQKEGKLLVSDVLPKLGESMHKEFGAAAVAAANEAQGGMARFKNEVFLTSAAIGENLLPRIGQISNAIANALKEKREKNTGPLAWLFSDLTTGETWRNTFNKGGVTASGGVDPQMSRALADKKADQESRARKAGIAAELARQNKAAADLADKERKSAAAAEKQRLKSIADEVAAMQFQAATVGLISEQTKIEELRIKGATAAQLEQAQAAADAVAEYEEQVKIAREMEELLKAGEEAALARSEQLTEETKKLEAYKAAQSGLLSSAQGGLDSSLAGAGMGDKERQRTQELLSIQQKYNEDLAALNAQYNGGDISKELYDQETLVLQDSLTKRLEMQAEYYNQMDKMQGDFNLGASEALANYLESSSDYASIANSLVTDQLKSMESGLGDAISSMVMESQTLGEAFSNLAKGMATSMINALSDIAAKWIITQAMQFMFGKATQASAAATMTANAQATALQAGLAAFASTAAIPIVGPLAAPGAMAAALAITEPMAAAVSTAALAGMAHDGIDSVPREGTWLLNKGERVTTAETSAKLDRTLDNVQKSQGGGAPIVNLYEDKSKAGTVNSRNQDGRSVIDIFVADLMGDGRTQKAMSRKFGMQPVGA